MKEKKFYIITFIEFAFYKLLYSIYYPFIIGVIRSNDLTGFIPVLFTFIPIIFFIVLLSVSIKYGKKHFDLWSWKQLTITLLLTFIPQLIPLPF
ncbi:MAG: hypothetical protein MSH15_11315 [Oscillospiraceae bacterium]|nr:hypothetical protein [Oscillospiraceae bacterium]